MTGNIGFIEEKSRDFSYRSKIYPEKFSIHMKFIGL